MRFLTEIFSVCVFASTQKQKSPLTPPDFTFSNKAKYKGTMYIWVTELHVNNFWVNIILMLYLQGYEEIKSVKY